MFEEAGKHGRIGDMHVVENLGEHLVGNVYIKFDHEDDARKCLHGMNGRFYKGMPITAQFCPVVDFREGR